MATIPAVAPEAQEQSIILAALSEYFFSQRDLSKHRPDPSWIMPVVLMTVLGASLVLP